MTEITNFDDAYLSYSLEGFPAFWGRFDDLTDDDLTDSVMRFIYNPEELTAHDFKLISTYLEYFFKAPAWR